jgi:hypothetical protein
VKEGLYVWCGEAVVELIHREFYESAGIVKHNPVTHPGTMMVEPDLTAAADATMPRSRRFPAPVALAFETSLHWRNLRDGGQVTGRSRGLLALKCHPASLDLVRRIWWRRRMIRGKKVEVEVCQSDVWNADVGHQAVGYCREDRQRATVKSWSCGKRLPVYQGP